jgi:signal transduction histidine kinase
MQEFKTYTDFTTNPSVVRGFGAIATVGYLLDAYLFQVGEELKLINIISAGLSFVVLIGLFLKSTNSWPGLKLLTLIFVLNLLIAPLFSLSVDDFTSFYLRSSLFYWAIMPVIGLIWGSKYFLWSTLLYLVQYATVTAYTKNTFLLESYVTITIVLIVYMIIIFAFLISIDHYVNDQKEIQQKLNESNIAKGKLLSIIGHDLRSPLMSLSSLAVLISEEVKSHKDETLREYVDLLNITVGQTSFLVNNLLEWSRTQNDQIDINRQQLQIQPFLESIKDLVHFQLLSKNISLHIGPVEASVIFADQNSLLTILRNLTTNAIKFTESGGRINFSTRKTAGGCTIVISDSGVGMDSATRIKLLDRSSYHSSHGTSNEKGTGIGFNLVLELVDLHSGTVNIESSTGKGTTISMFFPDDDSS